MAKSEVPKKIQKAKEVGVKSGPPVSKEELTQMLNQEMQKQIAACRAELDKAQKEILDKYQCDLEVTMVLTARGNIPRITVVPRPPSQ